jgi:hypothetical protein
MKPKPIEDLGIRHMSEQLYAIEREARGMCQNLIEVVRHPIDDVRPPEPV